MYPASLPVAGAVDPLDTNTVRGVTPLAELVRSQLLLEMVEMLTFTCPFDDVISSVLESEAPLSVSCEGLAVSELLCARPVSIEHTRAGSRSTRRNQDFCRVFKIISKQTRSCGKEEDAATGDRAIVLPRPIDPHLRHWVSSMCLLLNQVRQK